MLRKKNKRIKKDIPPEVLNLKKFQTEQIQKVADQLINKGKNPKGVIEAVGKMTVKINESRVRTDEAGEEDELQDEQDKMQKILSDYVDYMKKQLTEELTKEHKKLNEKFHWLVVFMLIVAIVSNAPFSPDTVSLVIYNA